MTSSFGQPRRDSTQTWKLAATAAVVVFLVAAGVATYVVYSSNSGEAPTAARSAAASSLAASYPQGASIGVVSGAPATAVDVPIRLVGASGLGSATVTLAYDPAVVTLENVANGNVPQSQLTWRHDAKAGTVILLLATSLPEGVAADGTLATVSLRAVEGAVGQVSALTMAIKSAVLWDGAPAHIAAASGTFHNGMPGDVNGDGTVDSNDYVRLARYLVGDGDVTIVALNADLDGDGKVTDADAMRLLQRLDAKA